MQGEDTVLVIVLDDGKSYSTGAYIVQVTKDQLDRMADGEEAKTVIDLFAPTVIAVGHVDNKKR